MFYFHDLRVSFSTKAGKSLLILEVTMTMTMKLFSFPLKHLHIHIYMTNNGNMEKSRSHDIFTIIIPRCFIHNHQVYTNPAILNYHVNKAQL